MRRLLIYLVDCLITFFALILFINAKLIFATISPIYDRFFYTIRFGHYDIHPDYETDTPLNHLERSHEFDFDHYYKYNIPYGLPAGYVANRGRGKPLGMLNYLIRPKPIWQNQYYTIDNDNDNFEEPTNDSD